MPTLPAHCFRALFYLSSPFIVVFALCVLPPCSAAAAAHIHTRTHIHGDRPHSWRRWLFEPRFPLVPPAAALVVVVLVHFWHCFSLLFGSVAMRGCANNNNNKSNETTFVDGFCWRWCHKFLLVRGNEARLERATGGAGSKRQPGKRSGVMTLLFFFIFFAVRFLEIKNMLLARFANSRSIAYSVAAATQLRLQQEIHIHTRTPSHVCVHLYLFFARKHFRHFKCSERSDQTG